MAKDSVDDMGNRLGAVVLETIRGAKLPLLLRSGKLLDRSRTLAGRPANFFLASTGLLLFQTLFAADLLGAFLTGKHWIGGTEFMFDAQLPLFLRLLSLFHVVTPPLLLWAIWRLGYDKRGWKLQTLTMWIVVPIN